MKLSNEILTQFVITLKVEFISGKFFDETQNEIKNINKFIQDRCYAKFKVYANSEQMRYIKEVIQYSTSVREKWYDSPIIAKAKSSYNLANFDKLAFPLDKKQLQILNLLLYHPDAELMVIATGIGGSGKSTFLNIVRQLFDNDYSATSLSDLSNEFRAAEAVKCRLICSDELASDDLDSKILKTLISHQPYQINSKNQTPYTVNTQSQLFFCCNKPPRIDIQDSGILRRIVFYERNTKIKSPNTSLKSKEYTEDELLNIARCAYLTDFNIEDFKKETFKYITSTNTCCQWRKKNPENDCYSDYKDYCLRNSFRPLNRTNFDAIIEWYDENSKLYKEITLEKLSQEEINELGDIF